MIKKLNEMVPSQSGKIVKLRGMGPLRQRMMDMGLVPGAEIKVVRVAPLGDPIEYEIKGYHLSLRQREAQHILVEIDYITLQESQPGETVRLMDMYNGQHFIQRLKAMGLKKGQVIKILRNTHNAPLIVRVNEREIDIGQGMARKMFVEPVSAAGEMK